jgi:hypothetical protein
VNPDPEAVDEHIAGFPPETRNALEEVRDLVRTSAPEATESTSYGVSTFVLSLPTASAVRPMAFPSKTGPDPRRTHS